MYIHCTIENWKENCSIYASLRGKIIGIKFEANNFCCDLRVKKSINCFRVCRRCRTTIDFYLHRLSRKAHQHASFHLHTTILGFDSFHGFQSSCGDETLLL